MRDAVENLALAYIEIRREGCIQFDDLLVRIHCNPDRSTVVEIILQSIDKVFSGRAQEKTALAHCQYLYEYLNNCMQKWKAAMTDERR